MILKALADPRGGAKDAPPLGPNSVSFSCSFRQKSCQIIGFHPKLRGWLPPSENSCIHHWKDWLNIVIQWIRLFCRLTNKIKFINCYRLWIHLNHYKILYKLCLQEVKTANEARAALSPFKNHSLSMLQSTSQMAAAAELLDHVIPLAWVDQQVQAGSPSYLLLDCLQKNFFA